MAKLLLVEDNDDEAQMTLVWLQDENYAVTWAGSGERALDYLAAETYDVILLDWDLPRKSGVELLRELREKGDNTPVIMLTAHDTAKDKEKGLDCGADDYLAKPFDLVELCARIRVQLRRSAGSKSNVLTLGGITLDSAQYRVKRDGKEVKLLPKEFALLEFFMRNPDKVFSAEAIMHRVWQSEEDGSTNAVRSCLKRLRQRLELGADDDFIETVAGVGYRCNTGN
ncbi:MAG: DNA-binding response regulator [Cyanobacteria bacterium PR.3.49]|nr:DNA-binding response regulator [Cyanobacteria bacterium PR.3.49]